MHGFCINEDVWIKNKVFHRFFKAADPKAAKPEEIYMAMAGELEMLKAYFKQQAKDQDKPEDAYLNKISYFQEDSFISWPRFPRRLGRISTKLRSGLHFHEEPAPLSLQLQALYEEKPTKKHFRIAIINGFGTNLGDSLMGSTALRHAIAEIKKHLPSFSIDLLLGYSNSSFNSDILCHEDHVEQVFSFSPTIEDFTRYDAYFDFGNLLSEPKFFEMPTADWYLWWLGLDPDAIAPQDKRNKIHIKLHEWNAVKELLRAYPGKKRIYFNPKASVALRSIPEHVCKSIIETILRADSEILLFIDQNMDLPFDNNRLITLAKQIDSPEKHKALIAQMDGVITVNTLAQHVADAVSVPCVQICSTMPPEFYPYYSFMAKLNIPHYTELPCYKKTKVVPEKDWETMRDAYTNAWEQLNIQEVLAALENMIALKKQTNDPGKLFLVHGIPQRSFLRQNANNTHDFKYDEYSELWKKSQQRLQELAQSVIRIGSHILLAGAGQSELPLSLAKCIRNEGKLSIVEPRRLRALKLNSDLLQNGLTNYTIYEQLVLENNEAKPVHAFDPWSVSKPEEWGNLDQTITLPAMTLDEFSLSVCNLLIIQPPLPAANLLHGAVDTLKRCRPVLLMSCLNQAHIASACSVVKSLDYTFWGEASLLAGDLEQMTVIAVPSEMDADLSGFVNIAIE